MRELSLLEIISLPNHAQALKLAITTVVTVTVELYCTVAP